MKLKANANISGSALKMRVRYGVPILLTDIGRWMEHLSRPLEVEHAVFSYVYDSSPVNVVIYSFGGLILRNYI